MSHALLTTSAGFLLILTRFLGMMAVAPMFAGRWAPVRFRLGLAFVLALLLVGQIPAVSLDPGGGALPLMLALAAEAALGLTFGTCVLALCTALSVAGKSIAYVSGLSFPVDAGLSNEGAPILGQFFFLLGLGVVFLADGHLLVLESVLESFRTFPPGDVFLTRSLFLTVPQAVAEGFRLGVHLALPIFAVILLSQLGMAILNRVLPQMNVFMLSFSVNAMLVMFVLAVGLGAAMLLFRERFFLLWDGFSREVLSHVG